jgi:molybdate transport system substrate-binding protein
VTRAVALALLVAVAAPALASAAEVTVLCPRAVQRVVAAAAQDFQRRSRHAVWLSYGDADAIAARARAGGADVVIASDAALAQLEAEGALRAGSRIVLGQVGLGVAVRAGARLPDLADERALRRALLQATSIGYADPVVAGVLDRLTIGAIVLPKTTVFPDGRRALEAVARDRVALVVAPVSEIVGSEGVAFAGALPATVQQTLVYGAAVSTRSATPDVAVAFLAHLRSADVRDRLRAGGLEE